MGMGPWGGSGPQQWVVVAEDKDINFYCTPVFYLSPFSIANLGRFGAGRFIDSRIKKGADPAKLRLSTDYFLDVQQFWINAGGGERILLQLKCS